MFDSTQKHKIKSFLADKVMASAVKTALREVFLKSQGTTDVQTLAAERIAITLLDEGFKELKKYSNQTEQKPREPRQVGL